MKKQVIRFFYLFCVSLMLFGCEAESLYLKDSHHQSNRKNSAKLLTGNEAKKVVNQLNSKLEGFGNSRLSNSNTRLRTNGQSIDFNSILQVIDSLGTANYTFRILNHPSDDYKTFHNLVVTEKETELKISTLKYVMEEQFAIAYNSGIKAFEEFKGQVISSPLIFTNPNTSNDNPTIDCNDLVFETPEEEDPNPPAGGSGIGSGTGSSGTGSSGSGGNNVPTLCNSVTMTFICTGKPNEPCGRTYSDFDVYKNSVCGNGNYSLNVTVTFSTVFCRLMYPDPCITDGDVGVLEPIENIPDLIEEKIDDTLLDPCTKGILDKLKNLQQNDISKIIERFDSPSSSFNVNFSQISNLVNPNSQLPVYGLFEPTQESLNYNIKLNSDYFKDN